MKIGIKRVGNQLEIYETDFVYKSQLRKYIKAEFLDQAYIGSKELQLIVDDIGMLLDIPLNFHIYTTDYEFVNVYGDVIFARFKTGNSKEEQWDYEIDNLTDADIEIINDIISTDSKMSIL